MASAASTRAKPGRPVPVEELARAMRELAAQGRIEDAIVLAINAVVQLNWSLTQAQVAIEQLLKKHLGQTSERLSPGQADLFLAAVSEEDKKHLEKMLEDDPEEAERERKRKAERKETGKHGRKPLPQHVERRRIEIPLTDAERVCPLHGERRPFDEETSEELGFQPAQFYVNVYARPKVVCDSCDEAAVSIARAPDKVIDGGRPAPDLLAHLLVSKYGDHCPLHRLHKIYLRYGVDIAVSTLADWVRVGAGLLDPLAQAIINACLVAHVLGVDDTGIKVLDKAASRGAKRGHLWGHVGDGKWAAFHYTPDWTAAGPQAFLADREGYIQADAYKGFDALFTGPAAKAIEVGCWSHARRYWKNLLDTGDTRAAVPLKLIQKLYRVERWATEDKLDAEQRRALRQQKSKPILEALKTWLVEHQGKEPPKSLFAQACGYALRQWVALNRYLEDGHLPIDNSAVERAQRPIASGRKNYLFCGSDAGAERAAVIYTILGTCALNGVEPLAYLTDVLKKLAAGWPNAKLEDLLPPKWIEAHPEHRVGRPAPLPPN